MTPRDLPCADSALSGTIDVPASKSLTNRALIACAAAGGGRIVRPLDCDDTRVLAAALAGAGWDLDWRHEIVVGSRTVPDEPVELDLRDSGTGARLVLGLLAVCPGKSIVDGSPRLRERPFAPLLHALQVLGAELRCTHASLPVEVSGKELDGGAVSIRPEVSSQFVSSLLLAAPLMRRGIDLEVVGDLPSAPYLDLSLEVLRAFGAEITASEDRRTWRVAPGGLRSTTYEIEGDWSAAAFTLAAVAVAGGTVHVGPLAPASLQGDRKVVEILRRAGLEITWHGNRLVARGPVTAPVVADLEHCPDLFPALVAIAACGPPGSTFTGLDHLAHKESDRLTVMIENLRRLGAGLGFEGPKLVIQQSLHRTLGFRRDVTAARDHRIAMAMAVAALGAGPLRLDDGACVSKSYPGFWNDWDLLMQQTSG